MSEDNPYKAPGSELAEPRVGKLSYKMLAVRMLEIRERGGYSLGLFLRWNAKVYLLGLAYFSAGLVFFAATELWNIFFLMLGLIVGMYARDFGWLRATRKSWPFTVMVMDWALVRKIADE